MIGILLTALIATPVLVFAILKRRTGAGMAIAAAFGSVILLLGAFCVFMWFVLEGMG